MNRLNNVGSRADYLEQQDAACQVTEDEAQKQTNKDRRSWIITSKNFQFESESEYGFMTNRPLGRG